MSEWIKCSERLPNLGQTVLIAYGPGHLQLCQFTKIGCASTWCDLDRHLEYAPTHWQPLPEPPKRESSFDAWFDNLAGRLMGSDVKFWNGMQIERQALKDVWNAAIAASKSPDFVP